MAILEQHAAGDRWQSAGRLSRLRDVVAYRQLAGRAIALSNRPGCVEAGDGSGRKG